MKESIFITLTIILIYIFLFVNNKNLKLVEYNGNQFLIQNSDNNKNSIELLGELVFRLYKLRDYLVENSVEKLDNLYLKSNISKYVSKKEFNESIQLLKKNFNKKRTKIYENINQSQYTSYSVNKGEELVFCLKARIINNNYHPLDLLMYVAIHELAHCGCKEIGHTNLYNRIFRVYLLIGMQLDIYKYINYEIYPVEYCGMTLNSHILN